MESQQTLDLRPLRTGMWGKVKLYLLHCRPLHALLRLLRPNLRSCKGTVFVTRYEDVLEVLRNDKVFQVDETRVSQLNGGIPFLLGMQRAKTYGTRSYEQFQAQVMKAFRRDDIQSKIVPIAAKSAERVVASCGGSLDAIRELMVHVPFEICRRYYGIPIPVEDELELSNRMFLLSTWLFTPGTNPKLEAAGMEAKGPLNAMVTRAIRDAADKGAPRDTILHRLLDMKESGTAALDEEDIRVILVGMMMGFVPTCTMAGGHVLDVLLDHGRYRALASEAARRNDDERLRRCLLEAMRFKPLIREPMRTCKRPYTLSPSRWGELTVQEDDAVFLSTHSAMFDGRHVKRPSTFDPDRPPDNWLLFGYGLHRCIGEALAEAQITQTFKPLLRRDIKRARFRKGKLRRLGPFPSHLSVRIEQPS